MKLGRTENGELIYIRTKSLEIEIKGRSYITVPHGAGEYKSFLVVDCPDDVDIFAKCDLTVTDSGQRSVKAISAPLFFEQTNYQLIAEANSDSVAPHKLDFDHENADLRKSITHFGHKSNVLYGNVNFRNEIGMSDFIFLLDGKEYLRLTLEVFPSKIDYQKDYKEIVADVTAEVYNLAFDAFRRTYTSYAKGTKTGNSHIEFYSIIREIYKDFTIAADMIIARPHHVLQTDHVVLPQHKIRKYDNRTIRWIEKHPEHVKKTPDGLTVDRALAVQKYVTYDTRENRLAKYMLAQTARRLEIFKKQYMMTERPDKQRLADELDRMIRGIRRRYTGNFPSTIQAEPSESGMSLVFSMAPGYRDLFKYYLMLQKGLSVTGSLFKVSIKEMSRLYEYWCFIKLNSLLRESHYTLVSQDFVKVTRSGITVKLRDGKPSRIHYTTDKGETIELFYNPKREYATVPQKPDNVLSLTKRGFRKQSQYEYIFDAKYRIGMDPDYLARHGGLPGPKEDDINTMHRYRDAIVYSKTKAKAEKNQAGTVNVANPQESAGDVTAYSMDGESAGVHQNENINDSSALGSDRKGKKAIGPVNQTMFGAYVLFPYANEKEYRNQDFYKSIEDVNIGGLPFLPSATNMVRNFLEELIEDTPESAFERATLPRGIEEKLAKVDWTKRDVLIVNMPNEEKLEECRTTLCCHVSRPDIARENLPIHYVALYQPGIGIQHVGTVLLTQEGAAGDYIFKVDEWRELEHLVEASGYGGRVTYTNMFLLEHSRKFPDLHLKSEAEYRLFTELKRRVGDVEYSDDEASGFEFEGKKIVFEDGRIEIMEGKDRKAYVEISEFVRRPNLEFRRLMGYVKNIAES